MLDNVVLVPAIQQRESAISKSERGKKTKHHLLTHIYGIRKKQTKKKTKTVLMNLFATQE